MRGRRVLVVIGRQRGGGRGHGEGSKRVGPWSNRGRGGDVSRYIPALLSSGTRVRYGGLVVNPNWPRRPRARLAPQPNLTQSWKRPPRASDSKSYQGRRRPRTPRPPPSRDSLLHVGAGGVPSSLRGSEGEARCALREFKVGSSEFEQGTSHRGRVLTRVSSTRESY